MYMYRCMLPAQSSCVYMYSKYLPPLQKWLKEAEEVTWDRFSESLAAIEQTELVEKVNEHLGKYHEQQKSVKEQTETKDTQVSTVHPI